MLKLPQNGTSVFEASNKAEMTYFDVTKQKVSEGLSRVALEASRAFYRIEAKRFFHAVQGVQKLKAGSYVRYSGFIICLARKGCHEC